MSGAPSPLNRLFMHIPKRAEQRQADQLRDTFVDSGIASALETIDHQVLYGRRGTGKTHALRYLETTLRDQRNFTAYIDLRTIGSPEGLLGGTNVDLAERAGRLLVDLLTHLHESILTAAVDDDKLIIDSSFVAKLDALGASISSVSIVGEVEARTDAERVASHTDGFALKGSTGRETWGVGLDVSSSSQLGTKDAVSNVRRGTERLRLNFGDIFRALRDLSHALTQARRIWVILDEWSSVPPTIQPYVGEFLVRCILPLQNFTVKIGAIEQQSAFDTFTPEGQRIGLEVGADVSAFLDLDEFMVFEQSEDAAREFFQGLVFKHVTSGVDLNEQIFEVKSQADLLRQGFTDRRAFDELVRAAEGVPRDALNILAKAALHAGDSRVSVPDIRKAAQAWYQQDKAGALRNREEAQDLLNWIIDKVIRGKRARGFLVNQKEARIPVLQSLFDARVMHIVRKGYSAQDEPGERYDVYVIDYGAYVDLMRTKNEPEGILPVDRLDGDAGYVDVPTQDLRSLRRAIISFDDFHKRHRPA